MPDPTPEPEDTRSRFDTTPEEAALDMFVDPEAPPYDDFIRPDWAPAHMTDEEVARTVYIPPHRRRPGVHYLGPEIHYPEGDRPVTIHPEEACMAVPGFQDLMLPLLRIASDGQEHSVAEAMISLAKEFSLSEADLEKMVPSGVQTQFYNRTTWALSYIAKSLLIEKTGRGKFRISPRGRDVLVTNPKRIDSKYLMQFPEFVAFKQKKKAKVTNVLPTDEDIESLDEPASTPVERLEAAYSEIRESLADDLINRVRAITPKGFERLVVRLLVAMGYGGGRIDQADVVGKSGDDGIDGVIREDRLGLDMVYVQAKKWENTVGPGEIDKFVGSLMRKKANKGVFITSGLFTDGAERAAKEAAVRVRLIDGDELADLMIDFNVGVSDETSYVVKKLDLDFFDELAV